MRRALVLALAFAACLSATGLAAATAAAPRYYEEEENVIFGFTTEGFDVSVFAEDNDGTQTAALTFSRDGLVAEYLVPAKLTDHSLKARFGSLGKLNFRFKPKKPKGKCYAGLSFTGTFTFTGENRYVQIDTDHAEGAGLDQVYSSCEGSRGPVPTVVSVSTGDYLEAIAGSWKHGTARRVEVTEYRTRGGHRTVQISGFVREEREGMILGEGATVSAPAAAFPHNMKAGTATLTPPAPFTGSATLKPGRGGKGIWEGTLQVPSLRGGEPIVLTGPDFSGRVYQEQPFDE
jgi:hypothetical protein